MSNILRSFFSSRKPKTAEIRDKNLNASEANIERARQDVMRLSLMSVPPTGVPGSRMC